MEYSSSRSDYKRFKGQRSREEEVGPITERVKSSPNQCINREPWLYRMLMSSKSPQSV